MLQESVIEGLLGEQAVLSPFHDAAPEYGERCWRIPGVRFDVVFWDTGNGWAVIRAVLIHGPADADKDDHAAHFAPTEPNADTYRELAELFDKLAEFERLEEQKHVLLVEAGDDDYP